MDIIIATLLIIFFLRLLSYSDHYTLDDFNKDLEDNYDEEKWLKYQEQKQKKWKTRNGKNR